MSKKISELTQATTLADDDLLVNVDTSATETKSITVANARTAMQQGAVPTSRSISTTAPLTGGGNLSANRTLGISEATTSAAGSMSAADKAKLDGIESGADVTDATNVAAAGAVMTSRTITTTAPLAGGGNLSANRTLSLTVNGIRGAVTTETGTAVALADSHNQGVILCTSESPVTVTVSAGLTVGTVIRVVQGGAATVSFTADTGVTMFFRGTATPDIAAQWGAATLTVIGTDQVVLTGDLAAV